MNAALPQELVNQREQRLNESNHNFLKTLQQCGMIHNVDAIVAKANEFLVWIKQFTNMTGSTNVYLEEWFIHHQQRISVTDVDQQLLLFWTLTYIQQSLKAGREFNNAMPLQ